MFKDDLALYSYHLEVDEILLKSGKRIDKRSGYVLYCTSLTSGDDFLFRALYVSSAGHSRLLTS